MADPAESSPSALTLAELTAIVGDPLFTARLGVIALHALSEHKEGAFATYKRPDSTGQGGATIHYSKVLTPHSADENGGIDPHSAVDLSDIVLTTPKGLQRSRGYDPQTAIHVHSHPGIIYQASDIDRGPSSYDLMLFANGFHPVNSGHIAGIVTGNTAGARPTTEMLLYRAGEDFDPHAVGELKTWVWPDYPTSLAYMERVGLRYARLAYAVGATQPFTTKPLADLFA